MKIKIKHDEGTRWFPYEHECFDYDQVAKNLNRYDDAAGKDQKWVSISKIVVPTQRDKDQLLLALKYLHNNLIIDTDFLAVNTLVHLYEFPDAIEVSDGS